jgi:peptidoglycan/xylan/chitin deacetylase (PgdA/CDA1 family)
VVTSLAATVTVTLLLGATWLSLRYRWWRPALDPGIPRILMYHMVREHIPGARFNNLRVRPADFERQVRWLRDRGFRFLFLSELLDGRELPPRVAVLTFDDGYEDNYTQALPVLCKYGARATLFLVQERFDNDWSVKKKSHHQGGELALEPKLSDQQVREMLASGCFEIGGHSLTHADFSKLTREEKVHELEESRRLLTANFAVPVDTYAYTFGIYNAEDRELVETLGYRGAVTTTEGISADIDGERYELKRVKVAGRKNFLHFRLSLRLGPGSLL